MKTKFKKGDRVKVWSLQSFSGGGFLKGEPAFVRHDQDEGDSVLLCVVRKIDGEYKVDTSYEVYDRQCELIKENLKPENMEYQSARHDLEMYYKEIMSD
jgi:hypothetical protein